MTFQGIDVGVNLDSFSAMCHGMVLNCIEESSLFRLDVDFIS